VSELPGVSIVIPNYNYGRFVAAAIESALAQDHPRCEVIVVDDCSTDCSREVIARYADQVRTVLMLTNGGQVAALNAAWPLAHYEIVIFLDSDDLLVRHAASTVARAWKPGTAKVQYCLASMDAEGRPLGQVFPRYPAGLDTATIRRELLRTGGSPSAPGSGNAYARRLLERLAPVGGLMWMDALLEVEAPFAGEVLTLPEPLACYRMHDSNWSQQTSMTAERFDKLTRFFDEKLEYLERRCREQGVDFNPAVAKRRAVWYAEYELAAAKMGYMGRRPVAAVLRSSFTSALRSPYPLGQRLARAAWAVAVATLPLRLAERVIAARFVIQRRPRWVERLFAQRGTPAVQGTSGS
jgi:glycosyltransferase involved in cell wall biosynthesis